MGDVLSQNQIDALLSSLQAGNTEEPEESPKEEQYRKYDFSTPKKFTKDRLRMISSVYENYARIVSSHLTSMLRLGCDIELLSVEEQRYYEFDNALAEDNLLIMTDVYPDPENNDNEPAESPLMLVLSPSLIDSILDRMMGGTGELDEDSTEEGGYTDIELGVFKQVVDHIIPIMDDVWQSYLDMKFCFRKIESNPKLVQAMNVDDVVVIIVLNMNLNGVMGQLTICTPGDILEDIFKRFEQLAVSASRRRDSQTPQDKNELLSNVKSSLLEIKAEFPPSLTTMQDVLQMNVGDVINLHIPSHTDILLSIEDIPHFTAKLGAYQENKAIKITGIYESEEYQTIKGEA